MLKPGTVEFIKLQGVTIEGDVEMVLADFRCLNGTGDISLDTSWLPIFPKAYPAAVRAGLIEKMPPDFCCEVSYRFTDKGKSIWGLYLLLIESGAAPEPFRRSDSFRIHGSNRP